jgi:hypothetical protein
LKPQPTKLTIEFGKPRHAWLFVNLRTDNFCLEFDASGVLHDPLADLISCLLLVMQGVEASVSWWLEPAEISFQFSSQPHGIQFSIFELDDLHATRPLLKRQLLCVEANYEAIILPFWRALQKLDPADFKEGNWYPLPLEKLKKLTQLIKARKQLG